MKQLYMILALSGILLFSSCYTTQTAGRSGKVPPGQARKYNNHNKGKKAAKYHPGKKKKHHKH